MENSNIDNELNDSTNGKQHEPESQYSAVMTDDQHHALLQKAAQSTTACMKELIDEAFVTHGLPLDREAQYTKEQKDLVHAIHHIALDGLMINACALFTTTGHGMASAVAEFIEGYEKAVQARRDRETQAMMARLLSGFTVVDDADDEDKGGEIEEASSPRAVT